MRLHRRHTVVRSMALVAMLALAPAAAAQARPPGLDLRQPLGGGAAQHRPGVRAGAPSPQALAASVQQAAGVAPSQVTAVDVCSAPAPGHAACAAQKLILRSTHRLVHPHVTPHPTFTQVFPTRRARAGAPSAPAAAPAGSMSSSPAAAPGAGTPAYLQQAYDLTYLSQTAGGSDTVAVVDAGDDANAQLDLATYRSTYGLPPCTTANGCFSKVNQSGTASPLPGPAGSDWESEISLDLDAVSALCPNCHILLVETNSSSLSDLDSGIAAAIGLGANQVSNSWAGASSAPVGVSSFSGAAVIAATGDHGYTGAGVDNYPAAFPGVTAAGGTTLSGAAGGTSTRGYTESAWALNSSGVGWGGGSGCDGNEPKPGYQTDTGCTGRASADLSADANPDTGLRIYDSGNGGWFVAGGTSLATPLIAAFEALTGVNGTTPQWAYTDSGLLNDPVTGSTGSCAAAIAYICNAGTGYDGPTGIGSISGAIVNGAPGIGGPANGDGTTNTYAQTVGSTTASLSGGVYPNGLDTTYYWQYGPSTAYGQQTAAVDVGSGRAPVAAPASLSGLTPGATYHYRLVASNSDGTDYGYDYTLATSTVSNVPPVNTVAPALSGQALQGQVLTVSTGSWSPTPNAYTYQWQRSTDGGTTWSSIAGATASTYTVASGDLGDELQVIVSATNAYGTSTAQTAATAPVGSGAPAVTTGPTATGHPDQGQILSALSTWSPSGASYTYQWQSSSDGGTTWSGIAGATASTYTLVAGDLGHLVRVAVTAVNAYGTTTARSPGVGPVLNNAPLNTVVPALSGIPQRAAVLSATAGTWTGLGDQITYQWQRSPDQTTWTGISGATSPTYTLQFADEGDAVRVLVTATNASGVTSTPSTPTQIIAPFPPANTAPPVLTGVAERGATLNASLGTWTGPDNVYTYQWQRDAGEGYANIAGATAAAYTLQSADEGATVRVVVTATGPDATISQPSAPTATVTDAIPIDQTAPVIAGTVLRGSTLIAGVGSWAGIGNAYSCQWQRSADGTSWTNIPAAIQSTYVVGLADEGDTLRVVVTATNPDGTATASSAPTITVPTSPPVSTTAPSFTGAAQRGSILAGSQGAWNGVGNAYAYQWQRSADGTTWTNISGATALTYTVQTADEADFVRLTVSATNPDGSATASSPSSSVVVATPPVNTSMPTLLGSALRSGTLSATVGAWSGVGNTYTCQWQRSADGSTTWTNIAGATTFSYTVAVADEGSAIRALITAVNPDGTAANGSAATAVISAAPPVNTTAPTITGAPLRGDTLTSTQGAWSGIGNAYAYQWQRSADGTAWTNVAGATADSYTLTTADVGDAVRLLVTVANPDATVSAPSPATVAVSATPPVNTAVPAISGAAQRGLVLTSAVGTWDGIGDMFTFQWQRSADATTWTNITGATGQSYQLTVADEGDAVRLLVTGTNPDGSASAASAPSATVAATRPVNTVPQVISGSAQRGQTLSSSLGTWLGIGNSYAYQWQRSTDSGTTWTNIAGATTGSYPLGVTDENSQLRVVITASNADGTSSVASAATATVPTAAPMNTVAPTVTGTARRGFLLTATPGTWTGIGNTLAYQWQRSTDGGSTWSSIAGATSNTYTVGVGDEGTALRMLVTAANPDGTVSAPSATTATVGASPPSNNTLPTSRGIAQRGNSLSSTTGAWAGTGNTFTLQWQRSADGTTWTNIASATAPIYTLQSADVGDAVRVVVTAANPDGTVSAASPASATVIASPPVNTAPPVVSGAPQRTATLSATAGAWNGAGVTVAYQWQRSADTGTTWTAIAAATTAAYTLTAADEGDIVRVLVTATDPDGSVATSSTPTTAVQAAPPINTQPPAVLGTPSLGGTLSTDNGTWNPSADGYSYVWQRGDGANGYQTIPGATSSTYTTVAADVGENVRVIVTATNVDGSVSSTSAASQAVQRPPVNITPPAAPAGTLMNGYVLTPDTGSWNSAATYSYAWLRCPGTAAAVTAACAPVSTKATYALTVLDIGSRIAVTVTAASIGGATSATSPLTAAITGQPLTALTPPSITGNPQPPNTLYANPGSWSVTLTGVNYDWDRCDPDGVSNCTLVAGDTAHYSLTSADDGHAIVLIANVSSPGRVATAQSAPLTVQDQPLPQATVMPTVSGTPIRTALMGATGGVWTNSPTSLSYQWERCNAAGHNCLAIPGATRPTYQLSNVDEGATVTIAVTAGNSSGTTTAVATPSGVVAALPPAATHAPALSTLGVQQSVPVSVDNGSWQATGPSTYATVWQRCNSAGASCAAIRGATATTYTPTAADVGHTLVVVVSATNVDGSVASASAPSDVVLPAAPRWRDLPVLSATNGYVGGALSVTDGVWTGPAVSSDTTQIMRCTNACAPISTASSYTIATADIGAVLRVRETASDAGGTTVVWSAQYVGPVASSASAFAVLGAGQAVLRNKDGDPLATAQLTSSSAVAADAIVAPTAHAPRRAAVLTRVITVRRAPRVRGTLHAWVCAAAIARGSAPAPCTRQVTMRGRSATLKLPATLTGRVRVVVRRGR
ncbi:MAG: hypothetical protein ACXVFO_08000 [Solirubrobacteraceae bacterium]